MLEELRARPGSAAGLRQRIGRIGVAGELASELQDLDEIGLISRRSSTGRESELDEFVITPDGLSLLGEQPTRDPGYQWPADPDMEGAPPDLAGSVAALLVALLDETVLSVSEIVIAVNATRGREWVTEAGILSVLAADSEVFQEVRPGHWTLRIDPGAQGAAVPARPYRPVLEDGAAVALAIA